MHQAGASHMIDSRQSPAAQMSSGAELGSLQPFSRLCSGMKQSRAGDWGEAEARGLQTPLHLLPRGGKQIGRAHV